MPAIPLIFSYELIELHRVSFRYHLLFSNLINERRSCSQVEGVPKIQALGRAAGAVGLLGSVPNLL